MQLQAISIEPNHRISDQFSTLFKLKNLNKTRKVRFDTQHDFSHSNTESKNQEELNGQSRIEGTSSLLLTGSRYSDKGLFWSFLETNEKVLGSRESINFESENGMIFHQQFEKTESKEMKEVPILPIRRAKPLSKYCQICKETFNDYLQHIEHHSHKKKEGGFTKSAKMIHDLVQDFKWSVKRERSQKSISDQEDDEVDAMGNASKIRVVHIAQRVTTMRINNSKIAPSEVLTGLGSHLSPEISAETIFSTNKLLQN